MRRRTWQLVFLVALMMSLAMAGCMKQPAAKPAAGQGAQAPAPPAPIEVDRTGWPVIVAFGDSLTFGQGVARESNYPTKLQAELDRLGYQYRVVNAGISGDTTKEALNRLQTVLAHKPTVVILELGANDGMRGIELAQMRVNLEIMIQRLQIEKVLVVLAGMQIPPNYGPDYTVTFKQTYTDLAAQYSVPIVPFFLDGVAGKPELNLQDGIHPTPEGYVQVVKNVLPVLLPLLQR